MKRTWFLLWILCITATACGGSSIEPRGGTEAAVSGPALDGHVLFAATDRAIEERYTQSGELVRRLTGIGAPEAINSSGTLFAVSQSAIVAYSGASKVEQIAPRGPKPPIDLAFSTAGRLFALNAGDKSASVTEYTKVGNHVSKTPTMEVDKGIDKPFAMTADGPGNLFVADGAGRLSYSVVRVYLAKKKTPHQLIDYIGQPLLVNGNGILFAWTFSSGSFPVEEFAQQHDGDFKLVVEVPNLGFEGTVSDDSLFTGGGHTVYAYRIGEKKLLNSVSYSKGYVKCMAASAGLLYVAFSDRTVQVYTDDLSHVRSLLLSEVPKQILVK